VIALRNF